MTIEVGGAGTLGIGIETTLGTYAVPTKWVPIRSESLQLVEDKVWRRNIRGKAEITGAIPGYTHIEGDIEFEVTANALVYFLYAGRFVPTKTGAMAPFTYSFVPSNVAKTTTAAGATNRKTLSLLVARSGNPMGYLGCAVGQLSFTVDGGVLMCTASIVGVDEAPQSPSAATFTADDPFGPGEVTFEIPSATARADADTFTLTVNDNLVTANRLNGQRKAAYQNWGEREITASMEYDFDNLTDYNDFRNQVLRTMTVSAVNVAATDEVSIELSAAVNEAHQVNLSALGDVVRGSVSYHGIFDTTDSITFTVICSASIT